MLEQNKQPVGELGQESLCRTGIKNLGRVAGLGAGAAAFAIGGAMVMPLETHIGPHRAEVTLNFDGEATGDFGPIGSLQLPVDWPAGIGATVAIKEVPFLTDQNDEELLSDSDIEAYARLMSEPEQIVSSVRNDVSERAKTHAVFGAAVSAGIYMSYGKLRRKELSEKLAYSPVAKVAAATAIVASGIGVGIAGARPEHSAPVSHVFDGTVLEGAQVKGQFMNMLVNQYAPEVIELVRKNDEFYDTAIRNFQREAEENYLLKRSERYVTVDFTTDRHCNLGMSRVVGALASMSPPDLTVDSGDLTMGGTALEEQCVAIVDRYTNGKLVFAAGNHDSEVTESQARSYGFQVLDGKVVEVEGLRILGDDDPVRSMFLKPAFQKGPESVKELGERLANTACSEEKTVDILLVHHDEAAAEALSRGCVQLALSGHTHKYDVWRHAADSSGVQIVGGTTGGAAKDTSVFETLQRPAEIVRIQIHRDSGKFVRSQRLIINEDARATIGPVTYGSYIEPQVQ